jgi:hypothetical protein
MRKCKIIPDEMGGYYIKTPFDQNFIDELKAEVVSRFWDIGKRMWQFDADDLELVIEIASKYYQVEFNQQVNQSLKKTEWETLYLIPNAPLEVVKAAYRALAMLHHPDRGGDIETMAKINSAYDKIVKA